MRGRIIAGSAALALLIGGGLAAATPPDPQGEYGVQEMSFSWSPGAGPSRTLKTVSCAGLNDFVISGGWRLTNSHGGVGPVKNAHLLAAASSYPNYSVTSSTKDGWTVDLRTDGDATGRTFEITVWSVCDSR